MSVGMSSPPTAFCDERLHARFKGYLERRVRAFAGSQGFGGRRLREVSVDGARLDLSKEGHFRTLARFLAEP